MVWEIDPFHSLVEFSVWHLSINIVKGRFKDVRGSLHLDTHQPEASWVKAQVAVDSIDTGLEQRDRHLRSADFFEVARYPTIAFESTEIQHTGNNSGIVTGNLTIHGVTQAVQLQTAFTGSTRDPDTGGWRVGLSAMCVFDRRSFNINFQRPAAGGIIFIGNETRINIHIEATQVG